MRALDYAFRQGWSSLWRSRGSSLFAITASALAAVVLGALLLVSWNAERFLAEWTAAAEFSIYLRDDATSEQRGAIESAIDRSGAAEGREYVSKADALSRFRSEFDDLAPLTDGFDGNPFPASLEVQVRPEAEADGRAEALVRQVALMPGVADVRYDREWLGRLSAGLETVRAVGFALVLLMGVAAAVTVAAVVRLGLYARRQEIEIMELVGAPFSYIRGPFVAEGLIQGGLGALLAVAALAIGFVAVRAWWGSRIGEALAGFDLQFLPVQMLLWLVLGGMAVGAAGGLAAARHAG